MSTVRIPLTQGKFALIDENDYVLVERFKWSASNKEGVKETGLKHVYAIAHWPGKSNVQVLMHRLIMRYPPKGTVVDHINGETLDNRRCNLRVVTHTQNMFNTSKQKRKASSEFKGVYFATRETYRKPWFARLTAHGTTYSLGYHATPEEAARAYDAKAREIHGDHARLNFLDD